MNPRGDAVTGTNGHGRRRFPAAASAAVTPQVLREVSVRDRVAFDHHQGAWEVIDAASGLHAMIAIHDTTLGPALGGCRMWPYDSTEEALVDALRLSRAMTFKASLAGLDLGGGKAVIIGDPRCATSEALFRAFGRAVDALGGRYITAEDVGTSPRDMDWVARETAHVVGTSTNGGDPSRMTALGVAEGIKAALRHRLGSATLAGVTVAVQGLGHVGAALCDRLAGEGARLVVADVNEDALRRAAARFEVELVTPEAILTTTADVFAPCALGGVLDDRTVPRLRVAIVAGSANNQLAAPRHGEAVAARGILYAPDYVINAGGLISLAAGLAGHAPTGARAWTDVCRIGATLGEIFTRAEAEGRGPAVVADRLAAERIARHRQTA